jgi:hypothetical protein
MFGLSKGYWLRRAVNAVAAVALAASVTASCSSGGQHTSGPQVDVTVKDFAIDIPSTIPTGNVTFVIHGGGPTLHEFNVARTDIMDIKKVPFAADDSLDDAPDVPNPHFVHDHAWEIEGIDVGMTKVLTVPITAGHYMFYCNMDGHTRARMVAQAVAQ